MSIWQQFKQIYIYTGELPRLAADRLQRSTDVWVKNHLDDKFQQAYTLWSKETPRFYFAEYFVN